MKNYIFGSTSAITTNICLIVGLGSTRASKLAILGALLTIALADNISDSLGIHMYQEAAGTKANQSFFALFLNFTARLFISSSFILIMFFAPSESVGFIAIVWGLLLLVMISYFIALQNQEKPLLEIGKHVLVASCVITASHFIGQWISRHF
jgi:vacuolar iron transporter family protein